MFQWLLNQVGGYVAVAIAGGVLWCVSRLGFYLKRGICARRLLNEAITNTLEQYPGVALKPDSRLGKRLSEARREIALAVAGWAVLLGVAGAISRDVITTIVTGLIISAIVGVGYWNNTITFTDAENKTIATY